MEQNGLPISIVMSGANEHDSTKFVDVVENISDFLDGESVKQIVSVYADKRYDAKYIRNYLRNNGISCCIPCKSNSKFILQNHSYKHYNKTRFVVERFFGWLKNSFHRTRIRYKKSCDNYLGFVWFVVIDNYVIPPINQQIIESYQIGYNKGAEDFVVGLFRQTSNCQPTYI